MKKIMFLVLAFLLLACSVVSAQVTTTKSEVLDLETFLDMLESVSSLEELYKNLEKYNVEIRTEQDEVTGKVIRIGNEYDDYSYTLGFYADTDDLWAFYAHINVENKENLIPLSLSIYDDYDFDNNEPYNNEFINKDLQGLYDTSYSVADENQVKVLGINRNAEIDLFLFLKEYFEYFADIS